MGMGEGGAGIVFAVLSFLLELSRREKWSASPAARKWVREASAALRLDWAARAIVKEIFPMESHIPAPLTLPLKAAVYFTIRSCLSAGSKGNQMLSAVVVSGALFPGPTPPGTRKHPCLGDRGLPFLGNISGSRRDLNHSEAKRLLSSGPATGFFR
jgi:hypothetical protein